MEWNKSMDKREIALERLEEGITARDSTIKKREEELESQQEEVKKMKDDVQRELARLRDLHKRGLQNQDNSSTTHNANSTISNQNNSNNMEYNSDSRNYTETDHNKGHSSKGDLKQASSPTYQTASEYPRTFPVGKRESGVLFPQHLGGSSSFTSQSNLPIHLQFSATNQASSLQVCFFLIACLFKFFIFGDILDINPFVAKLVNYHCKCNDHYFLFKSSFTLHLHFGKMC